MQSRRKIKREVGEGGTGDVKREDFGERRKEGKKERRAVSLAMSASLMPN